MNPSQFHRQSQLVGMLYPVRGHFSEATRKPQDVEGVVFSCIDRRLDPQKHLDLGAAYYNPREAGAMVPVRSDSAETSLTLGLTGHPAEVPAPKSALILGHDDCAAALIALKDLRKPASVAGHPAVALMRGKIHPALRAALGHVKGAKIEDLHAEAIRSTVLSSMQNAYHYALGTAGNVAAKVRRGDAQIVGGISGLPPQNGEKPTLSLYDPVAAIFQPAETLYHEAFGGTMQTAAEIEERMRHQLKGSKPHVQMGAKTFLRDMEAGIRQELQRIESLGKIR